MATLAMNFDNQGEITSLAGATHVKPEITKDGDSYTITGVIGLASQGWKMSIPTGDDGLPMFTVESEQLADGVKVTTSKPLEDGRVLTLRFDVEDAPEPEEVEPEPETD